ncbi:MAG: TonB-dependent receptor [Sulfuriferula sp.]
MSPTPFFSLLLTGMFLSSSIVQASASALSTQVSAVFDSVIYGDNVGGQGTYMLQEALGIYNVHAEHNTGGHNHAGTLDAGFNFRGVELAVNTQLPGWFDGRLLVTSNGKEAMIEEAWLRTQFLPAGLQLKGGKLFSDVGYLNNQHPHAWDFVDQALPYQMLFGGSLRGDGVQVSWLAPTAFYLRLGAEAVNSGNAGVAAYVGPTTATNGLPINFASASTWPAVVTAFAKVGGAFGLNHELQTGLSWVHSRQHQELHYAHPGINEAKHGLQGSAEMMGLDVVYKYYAFRNNGAGDFKLQAEYWYQNKDTFLIYHELKPGLVGQPRDLYLDAAYVQALYGIAPRWQVGLRYDIAGILHEARRDEATVGPTNTSAFDSMDRYSAVLSWRIRDNQQLRLQLSQAYVAVPEDTNGDGVDEAVRRTFNQVFLQYQIALGSHAAHRF